MRITSPETKSREFCSYFGNPGDKMGIFAETQVGYSSKRLHYNPLVFIYLVALPSDIVRNILH